MKKNHRHSKNHSADLTDIPLGYQSKSEDSYDSQQIRGARIPNAVSTVLFITLFILHDRLFKHIPGLKFFLKKPPNFLGEDGRGGKAHDEEKLFRVETQIIDEEIKIAKIDAERGDKIFEEGKTVEQVIKISLLGLGNVAFPAVGMITLSDLIQSQSLSGSEWAAFGMSFTVWIGSVGLKCSVDSALRPFKSVFDWAAAALLFVSTPVMIYQLTELYGTYTETVPTLSQFTLTAPEPKVKDVSLLYQAILISEGAGVFLLCGALGRALLLPKTCRQRSADYEIALHKVKKWRLERKLPKLRAKCAMWDHRESNSNAFSEFLTSSTDLLKDFFNQLKK